LKEEREGQPAIARLVTPKPYQFERLCGRIDQQEWDRKRADAALMKEDVDTSSKQERLVADDGIVYRYEVRNRASI
jgi:hypothetical protein